MWWNLKFLETSIYGKKNNFVYVLLNFRSSLSDRHSDKNDSTTSKISFTKFSLKIDLYRIKVTEYDKGLDRGVHIVGPKGCWSESMFDHKNQWVHLRIFRYHTLILHPLISQNPKNEINEKMTSSRKMLKSAQWCFVILLMSDSFQKLEVSKNFEFMIWYFSLAFVFYSEYKKVFFVNSW